MISEINKLKEKYDIFNYNDTCDVNVVGNERYISFIDSDDYVCKDFIETLFNMLIRTNADISAVGILEFDSEFVKEENGKEGSIITFNREEEIK